MSLGIVQVLAGSPGAGKTTLGCEIAHLLHAVSVLDFGTDQWIFAQLGVANLLKYDCQLLFKINLATILDLTSVRIAQAIVDKDTLEWPLANCALSLGGLEENAHDSKTYIEKIKPAAYETV